MYKNNIAEFSTEGLADLILGMPETVYVFALDTNYDYELCPWYGIVCAKIFDVQNIFINRLTLEGGAPFMFDLPDYKESVDYELGEEQSFECIKDMINGLNQFNALYGSGTKTWYVKEGGYDKLQIIYRGNSYL